MTKVQVYALAMGNSRKEKLKYLLWEDLHYDIELVFSSIAQCIHYWNWILLENHFGSIS